MITIFYSSPESNKINLKMTKKIIFKDDLVYFSSNKHSYIINIKNVKKIEYIENKSNSND